MFHTIFQMVLQGSTPSPLLGFPNPQLLSFSTATIPAEECFLKQTPVRSSYTSPFSRPMTPLWSTWSWSRLQLLASFKSIMCRVSVTPQFYLYNSFFQLHGLFSLKIIFVQIWSAVTLWKTRVLSSNVFQVEFKSFDNQSLSQIMKAGVFFPQNTFF